MKISTRKGPPTPYDMDGLISKVWKEPAFFLAHPLAIAAFGRKCTRRGVPLPTITMFGSPFLTWRGIPLVPSDRVLIDDAGKTKIPLIRTGKRKKVSLVVSARRAGRSHAEPVGSLYGYQP